MLCGLIWVLARAVVINLKFKHFLKAFYKDKARVRQNMLEENYMSFESTICFVLTIKYKSSSKTFCFQALTPSQDSRSVQVENPNLPPPGELPRDLPKLGDKLFAMRGSILNVWKEGSVVEVIDKDGETLFKLRFETVGNGKSRNVQTKILSLKHLAYSERAPVRLQVKMLIKLEKAFSL